MDILYSLTATILFVYCLKLLARRKRLPLPPGPKPTWIIGNLRDMPKAKAWITFSRWSQDYQSGIIYFSLVGQGFLVVNQMKAASELLETRASNYSDRPQSTMNALMGWDFSVALMPYGDLWRSRRKVFNQHFRKDAVKTYEPIQEARIHGFLKDLLQEPGEFRNHIQILTATITTASIYGRDVHSMEDPYVKLVDEAVSMLANSMFPTALLVNAVPILKHLPAWFPGAGFKRYANKCKVLTERMQNEPLEEVKLLKDKGVAQPCLTTALLEENEASGGSQPGEETLRAVVATVYSGAADTTFSSISTAFNCLATHPDVVAKARSEIYSVVGKDRLPQLRDRPSLPYLEAVYREVMRFYPVLPFSIRRVMEDDVYDGYSIPKGTIVIGNIWGISHDPLAYDNPNDFRPERFLDATGHLNNDEKVVAFGFGRRICVGQHFASSTTWLTLACVIALFDFLPMKDDNGLDIPVRAEYTDEFIAHPKEFKCSIIPCSKEAERLIAETYNGF
ncbi:cytochrome P450 [Pluteus cervinus]|uniref:Cytochrome P450 n=1 Tax=Pluteus cervinus TaxID=181527 RepID=A0ACD3BCW2_9AGAR|nr:cytochrome P450 [Pluteus cervinus]